MARFDTDGTKYHPLFEHLLFIGRGQITMSFAEIAAVIAAPLPSSAFTRQEWWSNSPNGHSQARAWMRANYKTSGVDLVAQRVTFMLEGWPDHYRQAKDEAGTAPTGLGEPAQMALLGTDSADDHPLFGIWNGKVTLIPDYDYTTPVFEADDARST